MSRGATPHSIRWRGAFLGTALAWLCCNPAIAASPSDSASCKLWHVQLGPVVLAIPHEDEKLDAPYVTPVEGRWGWLEKVGICSGPAQRIRDLAYADLESGREPPFRPIAVRGEFPTFLSLGHHVRPNGRLFLDRKTMLARYGVTPDQVTTRCRNGFHKDLGQLPTLGDFFGCIKDSGRVLVWGCNVGRVILGQCKVFDDFGPITLSYSWKQEQVRPEDVSRIDDAVIGFINGMIVSGKKLPR